MAKSKLQGSKQDRLWAEAKRRCQLNQEDIRMARELGLNPHSLIKNIPSPNQQWKLPVKHWVHELYEKKTGKTPVQKHLGAQSLKRRKHTALGPVPLHAYSDEPALLESRDNSLHVAMEDWETYADASWDDNAQWLPESPLYLQPMS